MPIIAETATIIQQLEDASTTIMADETITELQIELKSAVALASEIKSENDDLKRQLELANAFSNANLQRHAEWKEVWKKEREALSMREKQLEREEANWKARLEDRRKEMDEMDMKMINSNYVGVSGAGLSDLVKEIQVEHAKKTEGLINEATKWRDQCYCSRKSCGELQARHDELQGRFDRAVESSEKEIALLQQALAEHIDGSDKNDTVSSSSLEVALTRDLKLQVEEKDLRLAKLLYEVNCTRKARDDALCAYDELVASHLSERAKFSQESAALEAKNQTLDRRIEAIGKDLTQAISSKEELKESLRRADKELACLRESVIVKEEGHQQHIEQVSKEALQTELKMKKQLALVNTMLVEEQEKTKTLERQCLETQEYALKQISDLARDPKQVDDSEENLLIARDQICKLENTITDLQCEMKRHLSNHLAEVQRLQHACESCHKDLNYLLLEKKETERDAAAVREKLAQSQKILDDSKSSVQKLENGCQALREERLKLSEKIDNLNNENEALREKIRRALEDVRLLKDERENAVGSLQQEIGRINNELEKEKRRSEAYKSKALDAHLRSIKAKEVLDSLCNK